jgi:FtsZ-interacting cell division protein ZipA
LEFYILIAIVSILYWGFSQARKSQSSTDMSHPMKTQQHFRREKSEEEQDQRQEQKNQEKENFTVKVEVQPVRLAKSVKSEKPASSPLPKTGRNLSEWQKAWMMKEIVDQPRALRPYRFRQPR